MFVRALSGGGDSGRLESGHFPDFTSETSYKIPSDSLKSFTLYVYSNTSDAYFHNYHYNANTNKFYFDQTQRSGSEVSFANGYITVDITAGLGQCWPAYYMLYDYS